MEWISVKDRLPEYVKGKTSSKEVLVYSKDGGIGICFVNPGGAWYLDDFDIEINYWMPLPEPPKESK